MNIAIDAREWKMGGAGKSRYVGEVLNKLLELDSKNNYWLLIKGKRNVVLPPNFRAVTQPKFPYFWLGNWQKKNKIDLFFSPTSYLMSIFSRVKTITVVHDLAVFLEKRSRPSFKTKVIERLTLKLALERSRKIITVSNNTRKDILDNYNIDSHKIKTIYPAAVSVNEINSKNILGKYSITKPYILYVGTIEPRKNVESIIKAFAMSIKRIKDQYQLVLAGRRGWNIEYIDNIINDNNLNNDVIQTGFVQDEDLSKMYKSASLFVYPSWYEGFGMPVLEAMKFGVPVITSSTSSLPEVAGQAAKLIRPDDVESLSKYMIDILTHKELGEKMVNLGFRQASYFSWDKTASDLLKEFNKVGLSK